MIQPSKSKPVMHDTSIISRATASCWVKSSQDITTNNYLPLQSSKAEVEMTKSLWWRESKGEQMWEQIPQMTPYCKSKVEDAVQMMLHILNWMQYLIRVRLFNGRLVVSVEILRPDHSPWSPLRINIEVGWETLDTGRWVGPFWGPNPNLPTAAMPACLFVLGSVFFGQISLYILTIYCLEFFFGLKKNSPQFLFPQRVQKTQGKMTKQPKSPSGLRPSSPLVPEVEPPPLPQVLWTPWAWSPCRPCRRKVREPREGEGVQELAGVGCEVYEIPPPKKKKMTMEDSSHLKILTKRKWWFFEGHLSFQGRFLKIPSKKKKRYHENYHEKKELDSISLSSQLFF